MKIEINGKALLGIALLSAGLAFGEYVSVINAKSAGGVIVEQPEFTVGSVVFRMDDVNPSTIYGGTWQLIDGDATIRFGDGSIQTGAIEGDSNNPLVPLPAHDHSMTHNHSGSTSSNGSHYHGGWAEGGSAGPFGRDTRYGGGKMGSSATDYDNYIGKTSTEGAHTHSLNINNYSGNTGLRGTADATLDTRGKYVTINVWKRVS